MTQTAQTYGESLYELARDEQLGGEILSQLQKVVSILQENPQYVSLLSLPSVPKKERCDVLDESFRGQIHPYLLNFLKILTEKGIATSFSDCVRAYREQYNRDHNILPVTAVTAVALTQEQVKRLTDKLSAITGKTAEVYNRVDPACLGGVRLDYDGKRVDGSVANRLETVRNMLKNTVL